jgi:hypothetical protein
MNESLPSSPDPLVIRLKDKELVDQIRARARAGATAWLRSWPEFTFWHTSEQIGFTPFLAGRFLGYGRNENIDWSSMGKVLLHISLLEFRTFEATWTGDPATHLSLMVALCSSAEWTDAIAEAWEGLERPPHGLSESGHKLLIWSRSNPNPNFWIARTVLGRQARLKGTSWTTDFIVSHLKEIQAKAAVGLLFEVNKDDLRIWHEELPLAPIVKEVGPLNPVLTANVKDIVYPELNRFRETLYDWILGVDLPNDSTKLVVWRIKDLATLRRCFPSQEAQNWSTYELVAFLRETGLEHGLIWGCDFQNSAQWEYVCAPKESWDWPRVKKSIRQAREAPSIDQRYGISREAAAILRWFTSLRPDEWEGKLTRAVENDLKTRIGINVPWDMKNLGAYLSMLSEELSERTEWNVRVLILDSVWSGTVHRLIVQRKSLNWDTLVLQIQIFGLKQGIMLSSETVNDVLAKGLGLAQANATTNTGQPIE